MLDRLVARRPIGIWLALAAGAVSLLVGGGGQLLSLFDWDLAHELGFQEHSLRSPDLAQRVLAHIEWGSAAADALLAAPLFAVGLTGILCRRRWGRTSLMMAAICWIYMFIVYTAQRLTLAFRADIGIWSDYAGLIGAFSLIALIPGGLIIWGLAANVDRFSPPPLNSHRLRRRADGLEPFAVEAGIICAGQVLRAAWDVWLRGRWHWNVRRGEADRPLAGEALVPGGKSACRAISINLPQQDVWPWVAQFARGAGYYSWDFLDNRGYRHADYLIDNPPPAEGDWNKDIGRIRYLAPGEELVWYDETVFLGIKTPVVMTFRLDPDPDGTTRLQYRITFAIPQDTWRGRLAVKIALVMDRVMSMEMLLRIKLLAETHGERDASREDNRALAPHQRSPWRPAGNAL